MSGEAFNNIHESLSDIAEELRTMIDPAVPSVSKPMDYSPQTIGLFKHTLYLCICASIALKRTARLASGDDSEEGFTEQWFEDFKGVDDRWNR